MKTRVARSTAALVVAAMLAAGCSREPVSPESGSSKPADPESWTMSPDAFGPITVDLTKAEILDTGAFRVAPEPCSDVRLDWHSQKYESSGDIIVEPNGDKIAAYNKVGPGLPSITLDGHGKPEYIDPGPQAQTDTGIGLGDALRELEDAYGKQLIADTIEIMDDEASFAVNGERGHLVFYVFRGKVRNFYLTPGLAEKPWGADMRGLAC